MFSVIILHICHMDGAADSLPHVVVVSDTMKKNKKTLRLVNMSTFWFRTTTFLDLLRII